MDTLAPPLWTSVFAAVALDLVVGDPVWWPHPIRWMGWMIPRLEKGLVLLLGRNRLSGLFLAGLLPLWAAGLNWWLLEHLKGWPAWFLSLWILASCFAACDLKRHALRVAAALKGADIPSARQAVSKMVGRRVEDLDKSGVSRAAVESVSENTLDGVLAPLLFALVGGAPAALAYKAVSTLDSMVGHRNLLYRDFGWASARLDDAVNFIPARLMRPVYVLAALIAGLNWKACWQVSWRDGHKSPSPNSGISEAAAAGALGIRLGGSLHYGDRQEFRPYLGNGRIRLDEKDIYGAVRLMQAGLAVFVFLAIIIEVMVGY